MRDIATAVLDDAQPIERAAGAFPREWWRPGGVASLRDSYTTFSSETFIQAYLEPEYQPGCGRGHDPDCLCDVELPNEPTQITEVPRDFAGVASIEDLLDAAANVWMRLDLLPIAEEDEDIDVYLPFVERLEAGALQPMVDAIRAGCTITEAREWEPHLPRPAFALIRSAYGVYRPRRSLPEARVRELALQNLSTREILVIIERETGIKFHASAIIDFRRRAGIPSPPRRFVGKPGRRPESDKARVIELAGQNLSLRQIAEKIGSSRRYVTRVLEAHKAILAKDGSST